MATSSSSTSIAPTGIGIPQAMQWLLRNIQNLVNEVVTDAQDLVKLIPEASVVIQIKVGSVVVLNVPIGTVGQSTAPPAIQNPVNLPKI